MENKYLTVSALNKYLKHKFDTDENLSTVFLKGEISNLKGTTGHLYFSLKDENARVSAVMFKGSTKRLTFTPKDGQTVLVIGRVSVYEVTGNYQIYIEDMKEDGLGSLHVAFENLKKELDGLGLFKEENKKELPKIPNKIGIITAENGAAVKDILTTLKRRYPFAETYLFPSLVQGKNAHESIVSAIKKADQFRLDVIILGRGGGSIEDLWSFNEKDVAYAIFEAKTPIISAVGHEVDFTISDFVADKRAPTPTAAAEIVAPNFINILTNIDNVKIRANKIIENKLKYIQNVFISYKDHYILKNPFVLYQNKQQQKDQYVEILNQLIINKKNSLHNIYNNIIKSYIIEKPELITKDYHNSLNNKIDKLNILNPLNTLKRGYTIVKKDDKVVKIKDLQINDKITIKFKDGNVNTLVKEVNYE